MYVIETVLLGALGSLVASLIFLWVLFTLRPKIRISDQIAFRKRDGGVIYSIKVVNAGCRAVVNLVADLQLVRSRSVPGGEIVAGEFICEWDRMFLAKFDNNDSEVNFATRLTTKKDLHERLTDDDTYYLRLRIFARDELSNFGKAFFQEYRAKRIALKDGDFHKGTSLQVE